MWKYICACFLLYLAAYFSVLFYNLYCITHVKYLPNPFLFSSQPDGVHESCEHFIQEHVRHVENVHTFADVLRVVNGQSILDSSGWEPVIFKNYSLNSNASWQSVVEMHRDDMLLFSDVEVKSFGNVFFRGIYTHGKINTTLGEVIKAVEDREEGRRGDSSGNDSSRRSSGSSSSNNSMKTSSFFASFIPFLKPESSELLFSMTKEESKDILLDTNFISSFNADVLASSCHAATPVDSFALQIKGKKLWVFLPPSLHDKYHTINAGGPHVPVFGSEKNLLEKTGGKYIIAVQEEGDLLFFPPQWGHAVITKAGMNVMLNVRRKAFVKGFLTSPRVFFEGIFAKLLTSGASSVFNHARRNAPQAKFNEYSQSYFDADDNYLPPESGCKETWIEMLYR